MFFFLIKTFELLISMESLSIVRCGVVFSWRSDEEQNKGKFSSSYKFLIAFHTNTLIRESGAIPNINNTQLVKVDRILKFEQATIWTRRDYLLYF